MYLQNFKNKSHYFLSYDEKSKTNSSNFFFMCLENMLLKFQNDRRICSVIKIVTISLTKYF